MVLYRGRNKLPAAQNNKAVRCFSSPFYTGMPQVWPWIYAAALPFPARGPRLGFTTALTVRPPFIFARDHNRFSFMIPRRPRVYMLYTAERSDPEHGLGRKIANTGRRGVPCSNRRTPTGLWPGSWRVRPARTAVMQITPACR